MALTTDRVYAITAACEVTSLYRSTSRSRSAQANLRPLVVERTSNLWIFVAPGCRRGHLRAVLVVRRRRAGRCGAGRHVVGIGCRHGTLVPDQEGDIALLEGGALISGKKSCFMT